MTTGSSTVILMQRSPGNQSSRLCSMLIRLHSPSCYVCLPFYHSRDFVVADILFSAKVATAPSANIFTNREYEMLLRSLNVRRLSFVLFTGDKNHFLTQVPSIQEKLVDILKNVSAPIVQSEVFLCIRVLLCRLSPHNLTSFWPVLLTELVSPLFSG